MRVVFSTEAESDLEAIGDFIAGDNPARADSFIAELAEQARALGDFPSRFPLVAAFAHLGVRRRTHGNYLILYRVEKTRVLILRFIHGARDYEAFLSPGE